MATELAHSVRSPGFRPELRSDLKFVKAERPDLVIVLDARRQRRFELYELDCLIAREMNGRRDLDAVTQAARKHFPSATRDAVERLTVEIASMGLLENLSPSARGTPNGQPPLPPVPAEPEPPDDLFDVKTTVMPAPPRPASAPVPEADAAVPEPIPQLYVPVPEPPAPEPSFSVPVPEPPAPEPSFSVPVPAPSAPDPSFSVPVPAPSAPEPAFAPVAAEPEPEPVPGVAEPEPEPIIPMVDDPLPEPADAEPADAAPSPAAAEEAWEPDVEPWYRRKRPRRLLILAVLGAIIAALSLIQYPLYVTEPCTVRPSSRVEVRAQVGGILSTISISEGDEVEKDAEIARLDDQELTYALRQAEAQVAEIQAGLDKLQRGTRPEEVKRVQALVRSRSLDVRYARREVRRYRKLHKEGIAAAEKLEEVKHDLATKRAALREALAALELTKAGFRPEEISMKEAELKRAQAKVDYLELSLRSMVMRAPIPGQVLTPRIQERLHEKIEAGGLVCEIGDTRKMRVEIQVPERFADVVKTGQPVKLKVRSYPLRPFEGTVSFIAPKVDDGEQGRFIRVEAEVANPDGLLRAQMTGYAEIDTGKRSLLNLGLRGVIRWVRVRFLI